VTATPGACPNPRTAVACPSWTAATRPCVGVVPDLAEDPGRVAIAERPSPSTEKAVEVSNDVLGRHQQPLPVGDLPDPVAGSLVALREGQRARKVRCADLGVRPRTSRWWKPRKSIPSPPSVRCTMRVLAALGPAQARPAGPATTQGRPRPAPGWRTAPARRRRSRPARRARAPAMPGPAGVGRRWRATGDHPALRRASHTALQRPVLHHPGAQQRPHQAEHGPVADAFLDRLQQPGVRDRLKAVGDVGLHHPAAPRQDSSMSTCRASCADRLGETRTSSRPCRPRRSARARS
jgi:hypothetical protein